MESHLPARPKQPSHYNSQPGWPDVPCPFLGSFYQDVLPKIPKICLKVRNFRFIVMAELEPRSLGL